MSLGLQGDTALPSHAGIWALSTFLPDGSCGQLEFSQPRVAVDPEPEATMCMSVTAAVLALDTDGPVSALPGCEAPEVLHGFGLAGCYSMSPRSSGSASQSKLSGFWLGPGNHGMVSGGHDWPSLPSRRSGTSQMARAMYQGAEESKLQQEVSLSSALCSKGGQVGEPRREYPLLWSRAWEDT